MATSYGVYLDHKGFAARSTIIVDKQGEVRYSEMAEGERDFSVLLAECKKRILYLKLLNARNHQISIEYLTLIF